MEICWVFLYLCIIMVRVLTIGLMLIYAFSATGATVHLHYCCGKLQEMAMENEPRSVMDDCTLCQQHEENRSNECHTDDLPQCSDDMATQDHCKDVQLDAQKSTGDHLPGSEKSLLKIQSLELLAFTLTYVAGFQPYSYTIAEATNSPPPSGTTPLFIQHCTYRI